MYKNHEDFVQLLNARGVRYLIIGGYAVAFHAKPRATKDLDVYVDPADGNIAKLRQALEEFTGVSTRLDLQDPSKILMLGVPPQRVDVMPHVLGLGTFTQAWKKRKRGRFGHERTNYLGLDDLIRAKEVSSKLKDREQDTADLVVLRRVRAYQRNRGQSS